MSELENERETEADIAAEAEAEESSDEMEAHDADNIAEHDRPEPEPESEREPEQPPSLSRQDVEKGFTKLEREADRHAKRVAEIMGEDFAVLLACPLCDPINPGFVMPTPELPARFPAVRAFLGEPEPQEWKPDTHSRRCEDCLGLGEVATGSQVQGQKTLPCMGCNGRGWVGDRVAAGTVAPPAAPPPPVVNGPQPSAMPTVEPPEVAALREQGYVILDPRPVAPAGG